MTLTSQFRMWSLQRLNCTRCILRKGCRATLRDCCLRPWAVLNFWKERGEARLPLIWDIQPPLNSTLVTQSDCLFTIAPSHSGRIAALSGKLRADGAELGQTSYCDDQKLSTENGLSPPSSAGYPSRAKLSLMVKRHTLMLEEQNAALSIFPGNREHFPHSHFSINKVCICLPYKEIRVITILMFQIPSVLHGELQDHKSYLFHLWNPRKLPL